MKRFMDTLLVLLVVAGFTACDAFRSVSSTKATSQGNPYEVVVVCNTPEWNSALGDTIKTVLSANVPYLNQEETIFDLIRVPVQNYDGIIAKHRNILEVNVSPSVVKPSISVRYDITAAPQVIMTLQAPSVASATEYISENRESLVKGFQMAERDRAIAFANKYSVAHLDKLILDKFGVEISIPEGFSLRQDSEDFLWISHEYPEASQGVAIYSYPCDLGVSSLTEEYLVEARDKFTARIPGPSNGSYMATYAEVSQLYRLLRIDGRLWVEMRGFWDVVNDFMGGPYVSYSTIDEANDRVFTIDCYVYSPKYGKRNYLHTLEHLVYNARFVESGSVDGEN